VFAALGGWFGWAIYHQSSMEEATAHNPLRDDAGGAFTILAAKLWVDELYNVLVVRPFRRIARFLGNVFDVTIIDGGVDGIAGLIARLSAGMRQLQTGYIRNCALIFLLGVAALIGYFVLR